MKKDRKRQIRKYDNYRTDCKIYYGVFKLHGKLAVDPKRLLKLKLITKEQFDYINSIPRNTKYFYPTKNSQNSWYDHLAKYYTMMTEIWNEQAPLLSHVKTPEQVYDETYAEMSSFWDEENNQKAFLSSIVDSKNRERMYVVINAYFYAQFFTLLMTTFEQLKLQLIMGCGYDKKDVTFRDFNAFLKNNKIDYKSIDKDEEYKSLVLIYDYIKHATTKAYDKAYSDKNAQKWLLKIKNPDLVFAIFSPLMIKNADELIEYTFNTACSYLQSLCNKLTGESEYSQLEWKEFYINLVIDAKKY